MKKNKINVNMTIIENTELFKRQLSHSKLSYDETANQLRTVTIPMKDNKIIVIPYLRNEL
ncbi:hypothetical protein OCD90_26110 [Bacillus pacificus]|uniref:hypothetical protein n=1 Tax=Bacillus pacificus TaxID=2026187 RepID=UPI0009457ECD|nr:hypothetical protein [Bacillus pacificus]MCC2419314.1 hypothetical protein [Bacillus pacificus]MCU5005749.1 hypothetical protein [Bacillus pacificus]MCU5259219.1 hypothetical protein [Bacillus pacificus]HDR3524175.1 hypothetical protein [Bacillus pacificus]HDR3634621.1 hypothetical protein [Bacillus pacificus]